MIQNQGFVPFVSPISNTLPGSLFAETSSESNLISVAPYSECFEPKALRYERELDLPSQTKKMKIKSNIDLSQMTGTGNPLFKFNYNSSVVRELNIELKGAREILLNARYFARFFHSELDDFCKYDLIEQGLFYISESLKVEKMKMSFTNSAGGIIEISADNLNEFIEFESEVEWEILNKYELLVSSPKFIGYKIGKLERKDGLIIMSEANVVDGNSFTFEKKYSFRSAISNKYFFIFDDLDFKEY